MEIISNMWEDKIMNEMKTRKPISNFHLLPFKNPEDDEEENRKWLWALLLQRI